MDKFRQTTPKPKLVSSLTVVMLTTLAGMSTYEWIKQLVFPNITIWESHIVTIIFSSIIATTIAFFALRKYEALQRQLGQENAARQQAEAALWHEKTLMDALMNSIPDSIYFKDRRCRLTRISRKMMQDLNMEKMSQAIGKTDIDLFGQEFGQHTLAKDQSLIASGEPIIGLIEYRQLENGQLNWTSTTKVPLRDANNQIVGLVGITREINELIKAREAMQEYSKQLESKNAQLEEAIKNIKTLRGLIPICANCKKIRDDEGYWQQVEVYIKDHSEAEFSHGICPDCVKKLYPRYRQ